MTDLPKNFPEYSIMYKTLRTKIQDLINEKTQTQDKTTLEEIQNKIRKYRKEMDRIKSIFPEDFFRE
jgi:hypothetical protein